MLCPFGIFYGYLGCFLWPFGTLCVHKVHFFAGFGIMQQEKSGNPANRSPNSRCQKVIHLYRILDYINFLSDWRWYLKVGGRFFNLNVGGNVVRNHYFLANNIGILLKSQCYDPIFSAKLAVFFTRMPTFSANFLRYPVFLEPWELFW
jgi:hypothetical protein